MGTRDSRQQLCHSTRKTPDTLSTCSRYTISMCQCVAKQYFTRRSQGIGVGSRRNRTISSVPPLFETDRVGNSPAFTGNPQLHPWTHSTFDPHAPCSFRTTTADTHSSVQNVCLQWSDRWRFRGAGTCIWEGNWWRICRSRRTFLSVGVSLAWPRPPPVALDMGLFPCTADVSARSGMLCNAAIVWGPCTC